MGYFANLANSQNLEDMDISVHCDIQVFDWLMRWIKYEEQPTTIKDTENNSPTNTKGGSGGGNGGPRPPSKPVLTYGNAIPIMVSANFLQVNYLHHSIFIIHYIYFFFLVYFS